MVIFNHSNERGFYRYAIEDIHTAIWCWDMFCSAMCKVGVPLFFMISGANLLGKNETIKQTYSRMQRIAVCLIFWSMFYFCLDEHSSGERIIFNEIIPKMISGNYWHLWYLYAYIAFLFTLPVLRRLARSLGSGHFYLIAINGIALTCIMPIAEYFFITVNGSLKPSWMAAAIFMYPLLGYYIDKKMAMSKVTKQWILRLWGWNGVVFAIGGVCEWHYLLKNPGDASEAFLRITCLVNAAVLFITARYLFFRIKWSATAKRIISAAGQLTFGIYLTHILFLWKIPPLLAVWNAMEERCDIGVYLTVVLVFILAGGTTFLMKRIPVVEKIV